MSDEGYKTSPVVGYIRSAKKNDPQLDEWEAQIRAYAAEWGYNLVAIVRDEGVSAVAAWKPKLEYLIREAARGTWLGIITITSDALGQPNNAIRRYTNRIQSAGAWIKFIA